MLESLLSSQNFWIVVLAGASYVGKKIIELVVVKWPQAKQFSLDNKLDWVIAKVQQYKVDQIQATGEKAASDKIKSKVNEYAGKVGVKVEAVELRRRDRKISGSVGLSLDKDGKPAAGLTLSF